MNTLKLQDLLPNMVYVIMFFDGETPINKQIDLKTILYTGLSESYDYEYLYAIRDNMENILQMLPGQHQTMSFNRDESQLSKGLIGRIR